MAESRINYFRQYLSFQLGRLKACTVFSVIFSILGFPALIAGEYLSSHTKAYDPFVISLYVVATIALIGSAAMSFITPIISFQHLFTKVKADNILSLPLKTNQRFFADVSSVYISFHLPFAVSCALTYAIETAITSANYWICYQDYFYAFGVLGILLMFSALCIAIMTCCGRIVEAILYPVLINIVMPFLVTFGGYIAFKNCAGLSSGIEYEITASPLFIMWPVGALMSLNYFMYLFIITPVATAIYLAAAFIGYKFRRAENIGKPFVFKHTYIIFTSIIALALITGYTYLTDYATLEGNNIIPSILTLGLMLLILMLIVEVINARKIKNILFFSARFGITLVGGLLICFGLLLSEGFGISNYVPRAESVEYVSVTNHTNYESGFYNHIFSDDQEVINLVTEEHQRITDVVENKDELYGTFEISYTLKDGRTINRIYSGDIISNNFWNTIFTSEGYRLSDMDIFRYDEKTNPDHFNSLSAIRFANKHTSEVYLEATINNISNSGLLDAIEKDLKADTEYGRHNENPIGVLHIGKYHENYDKNDWQYANDFVSYQPFTIYEGYTNTLEFLSKYGDIPTVKESLDDSAKNCKVYTLMRTKPKNINQSFEDLWSQDYEAVFLTEEEFKELIQHESNYHNLSDDGYVYAVTRGISSYIPTTQGYTQVDDFIKLLNDIGIYYDNYEFFEDNEIISYTDFFLNENINNRCSEIFDSRVSFSYFYDRLI